jgi:hypothetical protein
VSFVGARAGTDAMMATLRKLSVDEQAHLARHVGFTGAEPDPLFLALLEESGGHEEIVKATHSRFLFPGEVVTGSYAGYLSRRRDILESWSREDRPGVLREWAVSLIPQIDTWIERETLREAEDRR